MRSGALETLLRGRRTLLAVAAPAEVRAVIGGVGGRPVPAAAPWTLLELGERFDLVESGIGKVNAGAAVARLFDPARHGAVLSLGIAGALPCGEGFLAAGTVVLASASVYADEGLETPAGFIETAEFGFPLGPFAGRSIAADPGLVAALRPLAEVIAPVATVSTCSGTDALARRVVERTGAVAEAMEGAAVAHVAARLGVPCAEVRVISNTTGDRPAQVWDLDAALRGLGRVMGLL